MRTLSSTVERLVGEGFTANFGVVGGRLRAYDSGKTGGVSSRVEKEKWRILPVGEVHDQPAALPGGHRRNAPWGKVSGSRPLRLTSSGSR